MRALLDVNVLMALHDANPVHHAAATQWLKAHIEHGWASCALTQNGCLRIKAQAYAYKGFVAENFVQQELAALGLEPTAAWADARAEIEFLITDVHGRVVPVEVKSGKRTRAKSLQSYIDKCQPHMTLKLTGTRASGPQETTHLVRPLYQIRAAVQSIRGSSAP